jgi:hypothetical protein
MEAHLLGKKAGIIAGMQRTPAFGTIDKDQAELTGPEAGKLYMLDQVYVSERYLSTFSLQEYDHETLPVSRDVSHPTMDQISGNRSQR